MGNHRLANPHKGLFRRIDIITQNPEMLTLKDTVQRVAANTSPVLIWGETGTGKELFAQSLHSHSSRARGPFVAQNCAAIPTTLLESTLFGTTRGSYTGAENRKGLLKQADGGTLFLDEVNSMDLSLQAKILKAIEEKRFCPVGGEQDVHSDVRIVSAMNVDPITAVREGLLRRDLFYRLGVVQLALPPLRKRPEDIPLLTDFYVEQYNRNMGRAISGGEQSWCAMPRWPMTGRAMCGRLRNAVESAFNLLCTGATAHRLNDIPRYIFYHEEEAGERQEQWPMPEHMGLQEAVRRYEKGLIVRALEQSRTVTEAAEKLRLTRQALQYKMMKYHLNG
ncbi:MAG: sigma-54 interaction domain-containing protein [Flavonifractor plautii]